MSSLLNSQEGEEYGPVYAPPDMRMFQNKVMFLLKIMNFAGTPGVVT